MSPLTPSSTLARFTMPNEREARDAVDVLAESFDNADVAVAAAETTDGNWDVILHFMQPPDEDAVRALVSLTAGDDLASQLQFDKVFAADWVKASLEGLAPVRAGRFVVHGAHDRASVRINDIGIEIEAALAFGTGHHGTTRGCLLLLNDVLRSSRPMRVLDLGTGSGVLAIAAAKSLLRRVLASDIDRMATATARQNAVLNGAGPFVRTVHATGMTAPEFTAQGPFDLVLANILANPLKRLATPLARHLAPGARVILSGLLQSQANGVIAAYQSNGLVLVRRMQLDGWISLMMRR